MAESTLPWVEKYRPETLEDVAAHTDIVATVNKLLGEGRLPHLLFYGPPGTGKTSTILAIARQVYGKRAQQMSLQLNASDDRGIDVVRKNIQEFASTSRLFSNGFKLVVLDECDAMTKDAQFALRRVIEKYSKTTRFCLICNYVSKIIPALQSRCTRFRFQPLPETFVRDRLEYIAGQEAITMEAGATDALVTLGGGDMRRTLNILQATCMSSGVVTEDAVYDCTGSPRRGDVKQMVEWLLNSAFAEAFEKISELQKYKGFALVDIVRDLHPWCFKLDMPEAARMDLLEKLCDLEDTLAQGTNDTLQLGGLVAAFTEARAAICASAQ